MSNEREIVVLTIDEFDQAFEPEKNAFVKHASLDGIMYKTTGDEYAYVCHVHRTEPNRVWTYMDNDDLSVVSGFHIDGRIGYIITKIGYCEGYDFIVRW
jgi:hypothetical protein